MSAKYYIIFCLPTFSFIFLFTLDYKIQFDMKRHDFKDFFKILNWIGDYKIDTYLEEFRAYRS